GRHMEVTKFGYHLLSREYSRPPNLAISSWRGLPTLPAQRVADASHMLRSEVLRSVRANQPRALRASVVSACVHPPPLLSTTSPVGTTVSFGSPASSTSIATRPPRSSAAWASTRTGSRSVRSCRWWGIRWVASDRSRWPLVLCPWSMTSYLPPRTSTNRARTATWITYR